MCFCTLIARNARGVKHFSPFKKGESQCKIYPTQLDVFGWHLDFMVLLISLAKNKKCTVFSRFTSFWWPVGLYSSRTIKRKRCQREILAGCSNKERKQIAFKKKRAVVDGLLIFRFSIKLVYSRLLSIFNLHQPGNAKRWKKLQPSQKDLMIAS